MPKRPLVVVSLIFAFGILLGRCVPMALGPLVALCLLTGVLALAARTGRWSWLAAQIAATGALNFHWQTAPLAPDDLRHLFEERPELVTLRGRIVSPPEYRLRERRGEIATNTLATVDCREMARAGREFVSVTGRVLVTTPAAVPPDFPSGMTVELSGILQPPPGPSAPGTFDYRTHLRWRGIHFELRAPEVADWRLPPGVVSPGPGWSERFQSWARRALALGLPSEDAELRLLWAMTLGWKTGITDEVEEPFMQSGTMHVFAISGLHIALIAQIAVQILRFARIPRVAAGLLVIPLCWGYTAATGWQPSAVRSTLMTSFVVLGWTLVRPLDLLNSLAAAALVCLAWEPTQLFQAGFQLSFAVVAALAALVPALQDRLDQPFAPDPFLPEASLPWWRRRFLWAWGHARTSLAVAGAAWAGSLPLAAHYFHLVTPASLLANLVVVPLSSAALASNLASLAFAPWFPGASEILNHGAWFWMHLMLAASRSAAALPGGFWYVAAPPLGATMLWYLLLFGSVDVRRWWPLACRRTRRALLAALLTLAGAAFLEGATRSPRLRLVVLPLRGGHAVWVQHRNQRALVDTGDARGAEFGVRPFLMAQGVNRLPALFLTHGDIRHVGGATSIVARFRPRAVTPSPVKFRSAAWKALASSLAATSPPSATPPVGAVPLPPDWRILHPGSEDRYSRADDGALVLALADVPLRVLLLADLGRTGQEILARRHPDLRADIVITGIPSGEEPLGIHLLAQLQPRLVIVADTAYPATDRAKPAVRERLRATVPRVLFTSETGALDLRRSAGQVLILDAAGNPVAEPLSLSLPGLPGPPPAPGVAATSSRGRLRPRRRTEFRAVR